MSHIRVIEWEMKKPEVYEAVAETLILYCQSDKKLIPEDLGYAWLPAELRKLGHGRVKVNAKHARIEMGGGFYHFGYILELDEQASTQQANVWHLRMYREDRDEATRLCTKSVPPTSRLSADALLARVLDGYNELITQSAADEDDQAAAWEGKIQLFLHFDKVPEARNACKDMLDKMPSNWWANLVCALVTAEEKTSEDGERFLSAWVKKNPNFFSYLDLAYYHQLHSQPKKAAEAMMRATDYDADSTLGHGGNCEYRGYSAAMYAFHSGEYQTVIKLCDKLLAVTINGTYAKPVVCLRDAAQARIQGEKTEVTWADGTTPFDPFEYNVDIDKLLQHSVDHPLRQP